MTSCDDPSSVTIALPSALPGACSRSPDAVSEPTGPANIDASGRGANGSGAKPPVACSMGELLLLPPPDDKKRGAAARFEGAREQQNLFPWRSTPPQAAARGLAVRVATLSELPLGVPPHHSRRKVVRSWATPTAQIEFFDGKDGTPPRVLPAISEDTLHLSGRSFYLAVTAVASCEGERPTAACATSGHALVPGRFDVPFAEASAADGLRLAQRASREDRGVKRENVRRRTSPPARSWLWTPSRMWIRR